MKNNIICVILLSVLVPSFAFAGTSSCITLAKNLSKGVENSEVLKLQQFLQNKGYLTNTPTGYFGAGTLKAVKKFQLANEIPQVGLVGPSTRAKIKEISCGNSNVNTYSTTNYGTTSLVTLSLSATPSSVIGNQKTLIEWKSTNANECYFSLRNQFGATPFKKKPAQMSDDMSFGVTTTMDVYCVGSSGKSDTKSVTVNVTPESQ